MFREVEEHFRKCDRSLENSQVRHITVTVLYLMEITENQRFEVIEHSRKLIAGGSGMYDASRMS